MLKLIGYGAQLRACPYNYLQIRGVISLVRYCKLFLHLALRHLDYTFVYIRPCSHHAHESTLCPYVFLAIINLTMMLIIKDLHFTGVLKYDLALLNLSRLGRLNLFLPYFIPAF